MDMDQASFIKWRLSETQARRRKLALAAAGVVLVIAVLIALPTGQSDKPPAPLEALAARELTDQEYWYAHIGAIGKHLPGADCLLDFEDWLAGSAPQPEASSLTRLADSFATCASNIAAVGMPPARLAAFHEGLISVDRARSQLARRVAAAELDREQAALEWKSLCDQMDRVCAPFADERAARMNECLDLAARQPGAQRYRAFNLQFRVTERTAYYWRLSWQVDLWNYLMQPVAFKARVIFKDADGFALASDSARDILAAPSAHRSATGSILVTPDVGRRVADIEGLVEPE